jgi:spore coat protein CotF
MNIENVERFHRSLPSFPKELMTQTLSQTMQLQTPQLRNLFYDNSVQAKRMAGDVQTSIWPFEFESVASTLG